SASSAASTGRGPARPVPRPSRPGRTTTPAPPPARTQPQNASLDELLDHDGPPPAGVADQLDFFLGGGPNCADTDSEAPRIRVPGVLQIPSIPDVCLEGFDGSRDATVTFTTPPGATETRTLRARW